MNLPLATVYDLATAADTTTLACHHGQMVVITIDHPTVHKTTLEMFPLGSTIPLATVARLAGALGLVHIIDADELDDLHQKLEIAHTDLNHLVGALAEMNWRRNELDIYVDEVEHQGWLLDLTLAELDAVQAHNEQLRNSLQFSDAACAQRDAQIEALRRALDAAEQASKGSNPSIHPGAAAPLPFAPEPVDPELTPTTRRCPHCSEIKPRKGFGMHESACARRRAQAIANTPAPVVVVDAVPVPGGTLTITRPGDEQGQRWPERSSRLLVDDGQPIAAEQPVGTLPTEFQRQRANAQHSGGK